MSTSNEFHFQVAFEQQGKGRWLDTEHPEHHVLDFDPLPTYEDALRDILHHNQTLSNEVVLDKKPRDASLRSA